MYALKDIILILLSSVIAIVAYFAKGFLKDFKEMQKDIELLKKELNKVEAESKRYWSEHRMQMENNHNIIIERINHTNENNKAAAVMIKEMFESLERRLDRLESK